MTGMASAIFAAAYRLTSDRGTAEEVVQETFLALWNRAETFDPAAGLARRVAAHDRPEPGDRPAPGGRSSPVARRPVLGGGHGRGLRRRRSNGSCRADTVIAGARAPASPEEAFAAEGLRDAHPLDAGRGMPEVERTVILLAYQEELSQAEIADRLGWPLGTVKTRTRRALLRLRDGPRGRIRPGRTRTHDAGAGRRGSIRRRWTTTRRANSWSWRRVEPGGLERLMAGDTPRPRRSPRTSRAATSCTEELAPAPAVGRRSSGPPSASMPPADLRARTLAAIRAEGVLRPLAAAAAAAGAGDVAAAAALPADGSGRCRRRRRPRRRPRSPPRRRSPAADRAGLGWSARSRRPSSCPS